MSDETFDPFAPQESGPKTRFVKLKIFSNPVTLETGTSYTLKEIHDKEGNPKVWNGKQLTKGSKRTHIILHALAEDKKGNPYEMERNWLNNDVPYKDVVYPSLIKVFGTSAQFPTKVYVPVKIEELPTSEKFTGRDGNEVVKTAWRVIEKYASEAALKAAEKAHFAQFTIRTNGATEDAPEVVAKL